MTPDLQLLICPDSFKGSASGLEVSLALSAGAQRACDEAEVAIKIVTCPLSDGGEGFLQVVASRLDVVEHLAEARHVDISNTSRLAVPWLWEPSRRRAWVETAQVVGLGLSAAVTPLERSAVGLADVLHVIHNFDPCEVVVGVGGTATVDGGVTVAAGLGAQFYPSALECLNPLTRVDAILECGSVDLRKCRSPWSHIDVTCWCDVQTPLVGKRGELGTERFAPQKGASEPDTARIRDCMVHWAGLVGVAADGLKTGAGGGIPFGLVVCTDATLADGAGSVLDLVDFDGQLRSNPLVWTGEGCFDATTEAGKLPARVLQRAGIAGCETVVFTGRLDCAAPDGVRVVELARNGVSMHQSMTDAAGLLELAAFRTMSGYLSAS